MNALVVVGAGDRGKKKGSDPFFGGLALAFELLRCAVTGACLGEF